MADMHTPTKRLAIKVDRDGRTKGFQLSIDLSDDKGGGVGYRLAGPKFNGSSASVLTHYLTERDADEIRSYLDTVFPLTPSQDAEKKALREALQECALQIAQTHNRKLTIGEETALDSARAALAGSAS